MDTALAQSTMQPVRAGISPRVKALLAIGGALLIAILAASWLWRATPTYRVLFTNLSDRDGGAIIAQLSQMNIPYQNKDGGTLLVPADRVHEARLKLAAQGLPKGSVIGFEIMESQKFGVTQFQEQVNFQRALEGELARSIQSLAPVAGARVHLALPKQSGFLRDKQPPTASVVLQLHAGKALDRAQVAGIVHLVSSSVPELATRNVSVVDQHGNLLATERGAQTGLDAGQLDYVAQIEATTIKRIEDIVEPLLGRGNVRAQVTADIDFTSFESLAESYKPNQGADQATVRSQSSSESVQPGAAQPQGVPGALSNQPPVPPTAPINGSAAPLNNAAGAAASSNSTRRDNVTNYEVDKTVRTTRGPNGQVRRLSAAVVVNYRAGAVGADGKAAPAQALSDKEMQNIQALVREAMGFNDKRGDTLNVVNAAFSVPEAVAPVAVPFYKEPDVVAMSKEVGAGVLFTALTLIVVFGVVRPALKAFAEAPRLAAATPEAVALPVAAPAGAESPLSQVRQLAKNDPATVANVVKAWVAEGK